MGFDDCRSFRRQVADFLRRTLQNAPTYGGRGWGLTLSRRSPPSITNTGEALGVIEALSLQTEILDERTRQDIGAFVEGRLAAQEKIQARTRDYAMAAASSSRTEQTWQPMGFRFARPFAT